MITAPLTQAHYDILKARAIDDKLILARGYKSIEADECEDYGFAPWQRFSGLLIPGWGMDGTNKGYQIRPDHPRMDKKGRPIKYESPHKQHNFLDMNPLISRNTLQEVVGAPYTTKAITEGALKGDALGSFGIAAIAITGVWGWRGKNEHQGRTALADWHDVAIRGAKFVIVFDSDAFTNPKVAHSARELQRFLVYKGAYSVQVLKLPTQGESKVGIDDYLHMWKGRQA